MQATATCIKATATTATAGRADRADRLIDPLPHLQGQRLCELHAPKALAEGGRWAQGQPCEGLHARQALCSSDHHCLQSQIELVQAR